VRNLTEVLGINLGVWCLWICCRAFYCQMHHCTHICTWPTSNVHSEIWTTEKHTWLLSAILKQTHCVTHAYFVATWSGEHHVTNS